MIGYQYLIEIDALQANNTPETLYFCCQPGFTSAGKTWHPNIVDPGLMQIDLFSGGKTSGSSTYSYGEIVLGNFKDVDEVDGSLDWLKQYQFYGRPVRMLVGLKNDAYPAGFTRAYTAIIENASTEWDTFSLTLHGRQAELDIPIARAISDFVNPSLRSDLFLGTNSPPDGLEGDAVLKDKLKPLLIGRASNFTPVLCNASKLIYACSLATGLSVNEMGSDFHVYDKGVELACTGVVSLATLQSTAPSPGQYSVAAEGYIRLGSSPAGTVTVSGASSGNALNSHPAVLLNKVLTATGFNAGDAKDMLDATSLTGISSTDRWERGLFLHGDINISAVIDQIVSPLGFWYFNNMGVMRTGPMTDPAGKTPVYSLRSNSNVVTFSVQRTQDMKGGIPAKSVAITHNINYSTMTDAAGSVAADRKEWLKNPNTKTVKTSTNTIHPLSGDLVIDTCITTETTAALNLLHDLHTVEREIVTVGIIKSEFNAARVLNPGDIVSVDLAGRFYYSDKPMMIIGITINYVEEVVTLRLWG